MSAKSLPAIAPCPRPGCRKAKLVFEGVAGAWYVQCECGWEGPTGRLERGAINAWNKRAGEGFRDGVLAAIRFMKDYISIPCAELLEEALDRGEVLPEKAGRVKS